MGSKKKDLEIIYNLQWKNKPTNGGDKANIIGMYDIPSTTLNWETFKSYLLKNSGTVGDDVKVSYITDSNREFPIQSQTDFQIALYAFRRKARMGDIVNLKLDRISDQPTHKNNRHSNDVETQFDNEAISLVSTCCNADTPPEWFITYMGQFKKTITDELTTTLSNIVSNMKPHAVSQPSYHTRKSKPECPKRMRKLPTLIGEPSHETKDILKSLKLESKLERKLEKLEHKTKKIKEKKLALLTKSSDSDAGQSSSRSHSYRQCEKEDDMRQFDAAPVNTQTIVPHMLGGEIYLHQWEVINTGKLPWTSETTLNFTWGAKALKPLDTIILVPPLKPEEIGTLAVRLEIPHQPGQYECYWHFHHKGRRFGHWLGCQVIVDPFDLKGANSVLETSFMSEFITNPKKFKANDQEYDMEEAVTQYTEILRDPINDQQKYTFNIKEQQPDELDKAEEITADDDTKYILDRLVTDISSRVEDMKLQDPTDTNCSSDSDNQSIISLSESNSSKSIPEEFVVVPIPNCFKIEQAQDVSNNDTLEQGNNDSAEPVVMRISKERVKNVVTGYITKGNTSQTPDDYDNNNNAEETNKNPSTSKFGTKVEDDVSSNDGSQKSDIVIVTLPNEEEQADAGYAYVIIDGHKVPIPKKILKSEYLKAAEEMTLTNAKDGESRNSSPTSSVEFVMEAVNVRETCNEAPQTEQECASEQPENTNSDRIMVDSIVEPLSHCSAAGSCFSDAEHITGGESTSRLFIFPQNCPGYEVQVAEGPVNAPPLNLSTHSRNPFTSGAIDHVPNYQQTPPNMRPTPPVSPPTFQNTQNITPNPQTQQVDARPAQGASASTNASGSTSPETVRSQENAPPVHILPETLVSGAVNVASSAINTARSVLNMIVTRETPVTTEGGVLQQPGRWVNGHWVSTSSETPREANLQALAEMGFWNRDLNATLLARYNDDLSRVVAELVQ